MNEYSREALDVYYADASSWNRDRVQAMQSSQRVAWWSAAIAASIALFEGIALVLLTPLKTVEPITMMVDKTTGYVQVLKPFEQPKIEPDSALTNSLLVQYVIAREGFDMATLKLNYRKVALLSADTARNSYQQQMQASNPASPLMLYPRTSYVNVQVKSVSRIGNNAALVRFNTIRNDADAQPRPASAWVAVISYRFSNAPMRLEDRFVNPLGFQVTRYRKDQEILSGDTPAQAAVAVSNAVPAPASSTSYYSSTSSKQLVEKALPR